MIFVKLSSDVLDVLRDDLVFVATSSSVGVPNVVPIGFARPLDDETILIADNFMDKMRKNLEENPKMALIPKEAAILMKIQETYTVKPGPEAGKKLE
jgi:hypothetical protein